jgi:hypothetical protein
MKWRFTRTGQFDKEDMPVGKQTAETNQGNYNTDGFGAYLPRLVPFFYKPLPQDGIRNNDEYTGNYFPRADSDFNNHYNNTYWGNRLPDSGVGIGITGYASAVAQKTFWTQHSPEQRIRIQQNLTGGAFPYGTSIQQNANILANMSAAWAAQAGHGV